jgi:hypothetical protein
VCAPSFGGRFVADFDRDRVVDATVGETNQRLLRPGLILLANLDIDDVSRVPSSAAADLTAVLDCKDATINGTDDKAGLTRLAIRHPDPCVVNATAVTLEVHADDANRIRIFDANSDALVLGAGASGSHQINARPTTANLDFVIEALTLPGDPTLPAPTDPPPTTPEGYPATLPHGVNPGDPAAAKRAPGEVWMELHHTMVGPLRPVRDVGLVTIAPFIMCDNLQPVERLYTVYLPDSGGHLGNHEFLHDLANAASAALGGGITLPADSSTPFTPHAHGATEPLFIIDGNAFGADRWIQDEIEFGYCFAPDAWSHVLVHLRRNRGLKGFVQRDVAEKGVGVFTGLATAGNPDGTNYGGNLEVSPPVPSATPVIGKNGAGPRIPAHSAAPLGKIIVGDSDPRPVDSEFHDFLLAQGVQPVVPVDTSWLGVGHVDEFCSFVPSSTSPRGFKMIMASVRAMDELVRMLAAIPVSAGRGHFHVGKYDVNGQYAEESAEDMRAAHGKFSEALRKAKLGPIQGRLERALAIDGSHVIPFPNYFLTPADTMVPYGTGDNFTVAHNVGSVNMQVVNGHLMIPRPFGPRLPRADAIDFVSRYISRLGLPRRPVRTGPTGGFDFWATPGTSLTQLGAYFMTASDEAQRQEVIGALSGGGGLSAATSSAVTAMADAIRTHPRNTTGSNPISAVTSGGTFNRWKRVHIPVDTLDVVEVYMRTMLEAEGNTVHFIDDFHCYHNHWGEVHCGTNVRRKPHPLTGGAHWWDHYEPESTDKWKYDPA